MLNLLGVQLDDNKRVPVALAKFYGIGVSKGEQICHKLSIFPKCKVSQLDDFKINQLAAHLNTMCLEGDLKRQVKQRILHQVQLNTVRGRMFQLGMPVNGQRSKSRGKTAQKLNRILCARYSTLRCLFK